ncbi:CpaF family protein [Luteococcus sp.]|uniref:CpaF family protein n=1 Tax=Luteococcus sp. TaxID=1969402 RepID=UPI003736300A
MSDPIRENEPLPLDAVDLLRLASEPAPAPDAPAPVAVPEDPPSTTGTPKHLPGSGVARPRALAASQYDSIDWAWVEELRSQAAAQLAQRAGAEVDTGAQFLSDADPHTRLEATHLVNDLIDESIKGRMVQGQIDGANFDQRQMASIVLDSLFGMGRLQPLLDADDIENIEFFGPHRVLLEHADSSLEDGPTRIFADEAAIRSYVSFIASRDGGRAFSPARPNLDLNLKGGERLSATSWVSAMTYLTIRKHRLTDITLDDLVQRDELSELAAGYLDAMVKARRSIVVAGQQGAGKTTLTRALCHCIDPDETIGTFETEYELGLHEMPFFRRVKAFEARPGSGERGVDGRQAGEITVDDLIYNSFRMNLQRQIVGEVRGREVLAMIKAMQSGSGSLSTTHSADAKGAVEKLITCALEAGPHVTLDYATRAVAAGINLIVYISRADVEHNGTRRRLRYISEICEVAPSADAAERFSVTPIFKTTPDSPYIAVPHHASAYADELDPDLFDQFAFNSQAVIDRGQR